MSLWKRIGIAVLGIVTIGIVLESGSWLSGGRLPGVVTEAQAIVGRPLTPVSVAGVARRTVRRCAVGVYNC